jgi:hypothetical protein
MSHDIQGMVRRDDHRTSVDAAINLKARRFTLREQVIEFAKASLAHGLTDDELKTARPETPESSLRKRRTELAQENILVETGVTRVNRHGQDEKVWMHRDFHPSPPPIVERDISAKPSRIARLEAEIERLKAILDAHGIYA